MIIPLPYGNTLLNLNLPDLYNLSIIEPKFVAAIQDPQAAIRESLQNPFCSPALSKLVTSNEKVGIIVNDVTRATPNQLILPEILTEIAHVPKRNIFFFIALGTHRQISEEELRQILGDWIVDNYRIIQNDAFDPSTQICIGDTTFGHQIWLNRELLECGLKILTGFIEPHFFAGFSGGGKAIMPGMAGSPTILGNHSAKMIAHPNATWGVTQGNPIFEEINEIVAKIKNLFLINVALNKNKEIIHVFSGDIREAHSAGCRYVKEKSMVAVRNPFDIVITTNSGFPLDINLYQSVKGMSAAAKVVKDGGVIIIASECRDGVPEHGLYGSLLRSSKTPDDLLKCILSSEENKQDQWQAQIQGYIQKRAKVYVYSDGLTNEQIHSALLEPTNDIEGLVETLVKKIGKEAKICVLPEGPQTIPYIDNR